MERYLTSVLSGLTFDVGWYAKLMVSQRLGLLFIRIRGSPMLRTEMTSEVQINLVLYARFAVLLKGGLYNSSIIDPCCSVLLVFYFKVVHLSQ